MATVAENKRLRQSEQGKQWLRLGLVKESNEDGEHTLVWTEEGKKLAPYSTRRTVMDHVMGRPLPDWFNREEWIGFGKEGFAKEKR